MMVAGVDRTFDRIGSCGVDTEPGDQPASGIRMAFGTDADGPRIELIGTPECDRTGGFILSRRDHSTMANGPELGAASMIEKVTLLALADLSIRDETPAYPFEVRSAVDGCIDPLADELIGKPDEAAVSRALNALEAAEIVKATDSGERSPVGKGRPAYALSEDPESVLDGLSADDRLGSAIERVRPDGQS